MRKNIIRYSILAGVLIATAVFGNNCARQGFDVLNSSTGENLDFASTSPVPNVPQALSSGGLSLMKGEQIFSSIQRLTKNEGTLSTGLKNEYAIRFATLPSVNDFSQINSPALLSITSLAGQSCDELVTKEEAMTMTQRTYFSDINFVQSSLSESSYLLAVNKMSNEFWGRNITSEEQAAFEEFQSTFTQSASATIGNQTIKNLLTGTCTAMLSSFESITY